MTGTSSDTSALHPLRLGLEPLAFGDWLKPQADDAPARAERRQILEDHAADVLAVLPAGETAVQELGRFLRTRGFDLGDSIAPRALLAALAERIAEDLLILTPAGDAYALTAGLLCFPNRWRLLDKLGRSTTEVHAPVPDYAAALAAPVDRFLAKLRPGRAFRRDNWGFASTPARYLPTPVAPARIDALEGAFLRREGQSFVKLEQTGAVVFAIRTTITPWPEVAATEQAAILEVIRGLSPEWLKYKSIAP